MSKKIVALLPLKAHSQRVQGKNFKTLAGKPLFEWILDTLVQIESIDKILINTDAIPQLQALNVAQYDKVELKQRPDELCGDDVSMNKIIAHDLSTHPADIYLMTHTTNPFLSVRTIHKALQKFAVESAENNADSLFTVNKIQNRFYDSEAKAINHDPNVLIPTQELEPIYEENSNLYIFSAESFAQSEARIGLHPTMYVTPSVESVDIDTPDDWQLAEILATRYGHKQRSEWDV